MDIKIRVAEAISKCLQEPLTVNYILPSSLDMSIGEVISKEMSEVLKKEKQ